MIILGIDPGTATTGYGVIKVNNGEMTTGKFDLIETSKDSTPEKRLRKIYHELNHVISVAKPDILAMEKLFFATNAKTAIRVGQAQGIILLCAAMADVPVTEYAPGTIKKMVTGNGRADKKDIQKSLRKLFGAGIRSKAKKKTHFDNAADALAVALCHIYKTEGGGESEQS